MATTAVPANLTTVAPTNTTTDSVPRNNSVETFIVALIINGIIALIVLLLFSYLRSKHKHIYAPRLLLVDKTYPLGTLNEKCFGWIIPALRATNDDVFNYSGMDALVLIRFLRMCLIMSVIILPYGIIVLIPLHVHGGLDLEKLDQLTLSNVKAGSPKVWAHLIAVYAYTAIFCYLLYREWKIYIEYRQKWLAKGLRHHYAVLVRDLPAKVIIYSIRLLLTRCVSDMGVDHVCFHVFHCAVYLQVCCIQHSYYYIKSFN